MLFGDNILSVRSVVVMLRTVVISTYDEQGLWTFGSSVISVSLSVLAVLFHGHFFIAVVSL